MTIFEKLTDLNFTWHASSEGWHVYEAHGDHFGEIILVAVNTEDGSIEVEKQPHDHEQPMTKVTFSRVDDALWDLLERWSSR